MIIEHLEDFREWLVSKLKPICDADPEALAKYIIALLKKDKPDQDLKTVCNSQLDVFLQTETAKFVDDLFDMLKKKSYEKKSQGNSQASNTGSQGSSKSESKKKPVEDHRKVRSRSRSPHRQQRHYDSRRRYEPDRRNYDRRRKSRSRSRSRSRGRQFRIGRSRSRSPRRWSRSRSRSFERIRRRSLDRDRRRPGSHGGSDRERRSLSPGVRRSPLRQIALRRSRSPRSGDSRGSTPIQDHGEVRPAPTGVPDLRNAIPRRKRCRDFDEKGFCMKGDLCEFDHGVDPVVVDDVNLPNVLTGPPPPVPPAMRGGPPMPLRGATSQPPPPLLPLIRGPPPPLPANVHAPPPPLPGMRGPPTGEIFPPGANPPPPGTVPVASQPPPIPPQEPFQAEPYNPEVPSMQNNFFSGGPAPGHIGGPPPQLLGRPSAQHGRQAAPHSMPTRPALHQRPPINSNLNMNLVTTQNTYQTELHSRPVNVPVNSSQRTVIQSSKHFEPSIPEYTPTQVHEGGEPPSKRTVHNSKFNNNERIAQKPRKNCSIEVLRIPRAYNNIAKLNEHFGQFGTIVNLQVHFKGNPESACVTYSCPFEATKAFKSTDPIFNNRFIRVQWHNPDPDAPAKLVPPAVENKSVKERLGIPPAEKMQLNNMKKKDDVPTKTVLTAEGASRTIYNPAALAAKEGTVPSKAHGAMPSVMSRLGNPVEDDKKAKLAMRKKEMMKKKLEIQKQKQDLLQKKLQQQKVLIQKLESNKSMSAEDRGALVKMIKNLAKSIDTLQLELKASKSAVTPTANVPAAATNNKVLPKSKEEAQKQILDAELEMISQENSGADTSMLRRQVSELKRQAQRMGLLRQHSSSKPHPNAKASKGVGPLPKPARSIDRRPRYILVTGFVPEQKADIETFLQQFGDVEKTSNDDDDDSKFIIGYKTRAAAEKAVAAGRNFPNTPLSMTWQKNPVSPSASSNVQTSPQTEDVPKVEQENSSEPNEPMTMSSTKEAKPAAVNMGPLAGRISKRMKSQSFSESEEMVLTVPESNMKHADEQENTYNVLEVDNAQEMVTSVLTEKDEDDILGLGKEVEDELEATGPEDPELEDLDEDVLLGMDEEEDEDDQERSWRR